MFFGVQGDGALAALGFPVAGEPLRLAWISVWVGARTAHRFDAFEERSVLSSKHGEDLEVGVIDGHHETERVGGTWIAKRIGDTTNPRQNGFSGRVEHPAIGDFGASVHSDAGRGDIPLQASELLPWLKVKDIELAITRTELWSGVKEVQPVEVRCVENVLEMLKPVERNDAGEVAAAAYVLVVGENVFVVAQVLERAVPGEQWLLFRGPEVCPDQSITFFDRVPRLAEFVAIGAALGFTWLVGAVALGIERPAVIAAANTVIIDAALEQR